jgi:hypothetical protein
MIYLFAGFLVELIWELSSTMVLLAIPLNAGVVVAFIMDLLVLSLFLIGAYTIGHEKKHFKAVFIITIVLIATSCVTTVLELLPVDVVYGGFTDLVPFVLGFVLTYQLIKGLIDRSANHPSLSTAKRLMTFWKASLWLYGGLVATLVVGLVTIMGTLVGGMLGTVTDPEIFLVPDEAFIEQLITDVLPTAGPFLIVIAILLVGLILAYVIVRILFVVYVYQLKDVKVTPETELTPLPGAE